MPTVKDVFGWTDSRCDVSRLEESRGWLGRAGRVEPEPPAWQRDRDPSDEEERAA